MTPVSIITSAAYVNAEIAAEFGRLPPAFLPFGHHRLYAAQIERLEAAGGRVVLTLPESFQAGAWDCAWLDNHGVEVVNIPDGLSLGESIAHALVLCDAREHVQIIHGDTLFTGELPSALDQIGIAPTTDAYDWGTVATGGRRFVSRRPEGGCEAEQVLTGWFSFSSGTMLLRALMRTRGDFLAALDLYSEACPLKLIETTGWLDFGHLQTFYRSRAAVSTARSFNSVAVSQRIVVKTGEKSQKLNAEAAWFEALPPPLRLNIPPFLGREDSGYRLGYELNPTLHELFVFGRLEATAWRTIIGNCFAFLDTCLCYAPPINDHTIKNALQHLVFNKTQTRLAAWAAGAGVGLDDVWSYDGSTLQSLRSIATRMGELALEGDAILGIMHGDLCFPNMFFDSRQQLIKVIDPRGGFRDGVESVHGDIRYDLAKLNHSVQGYDLILSGRYWLEQPEPRALTLTLSREGAADFLPSVTAEFNLNGRRLNDPSTTALTILLFLSMLPLHADRPDRQRAFLANALRLTSQLKSFL